MSSVNKSFGIFQSQMSERNWLKKHGKEHMLDFGDKERKQLKKFFDSLDPDGSGAIGIEELEDPLIALGLAETRNQVQEMVSLVDKDGSNQIEFKEFLEIIKSGNVISSNLVSFFKELTKGKIIERSTDLPFKLLVSAFRRKMLMAAMTAEDLQTKIKGENVMKAFSKQLTIEKNKKAIAINAIKKSKKIIKFPLTQRIKEESFYDKIDLNTSYAPNERNGLPKLPKVMKEQDIIKKDNRSIYRKGNVNRKLIR